MIDVTKRWTDIAQMFQRELERMAMQALEAGHSGDASVWVSYEIFQALQHEILIRYPVKTATEVSPMQGMEYRTAGGIAKIQVAPQFKGLEWTYIGAEIAREYVHGEMPEIKEQNIMNLGIHMDRGYYIEPEPQPTFMNDIKDL